MHPADDPALLARTFDLARLRGLAREKSGVDGTDEDPDIVEPLERILADLRAGTARLGEIGLTVMELYLVDSLVTRRRIRARLAANPAIARQRIVAPVVITGLPRTGTTKLQRVLAATGRFQFLPLWKILDPLRGDGPRAADEQRRIANANAAAEQIRQAYPRFYAGHPMIATEPDEESLFLETAFKADPIGWRAHVPNFMRWLAEQNIEPTYRWLASMLQLLQWQDETADPPRRWVLKAPGHLGRLDELFAVFPDATVLHCHRDPLTSLPSGAALAQEMHAFYSDRFDDRDAGRFILELMSQDMARCLAQRRRWEGSGKRIVDLPFADIVQRAEATCASLFQTLEMDFDERARDGVRRWEAENPAHRHGVFDYSLERYGLTAEEIREGFGEYSERFVGNP